MPQENNFPCIFYFFPLQK